MKNKLTEKEYKDLVINVAVQISPIIIQKMETSDLASITIARFSKDIADAVNDVLKS
jgi:hypothetical protein